jgi:hypothetical protein
MGCLVSTFRANTCPTGPQSGSPSSSSPGIPLATALSSGERTFPARSGSISSWHDTATPFPLDLPASSAPASAPEPPADSQTGCPVEARENASPETVPSRPLRPSHSIKPPKPLPNTKPLRRTQPAGRHNTVTPSSACHRTQSNRACSIKARHFLTSSAYLGLYSDQPSSVLAPSSSSRCLTAASCPSRWVTWLSSNSFSS